MPPRAMATYLYCVLTSATNEAPPPGLRGIGDAPIRTLSNDAFLPLEAWVGTVAESAFRDAGPDLAARALAHNEVVNAALATGRTPLPARYGARFDDDATCLADLLRRRDELEKALERVANMVEIPVLLVPTYAAASALVRPDRRDRGAGRRYLEAVRARAEEQARRRTVLAEQAARIEGAVGEIVRAAARSTDKRGVLSIAHLVPRHALGVYRECIEALQPAAGNGVRIIIGDVRAPYSFADLEKVSTGHDSGSPNSDE